MASRPKRSRSIEWKVPTGGYDMAIRRTSHLRSPAVLHQHTIENLIANAYLCGVDDAVEVAANRGEESNG